MKDKNIVITGCGGALGQAFVRSLIRRGYNVLGTEISVKKAKLTAESINHENFSCEKCDVASEKEVNELFNLYSKKNITPDILINNASITSELLKARDLEPKSFTETSYASWKECIDVNLNGVFLMSKKFVQAQTEVNKDEIKKIINISSMYALNGPNPDLYKNTGIKSIAAYSASKAGVIGLTKWLAGFLAPSITCNAIAPGGVFNNQSRDFVEKLSSMTPLGRMAKPSDISGTLDFLCSDESNYINGQVLYVDGGYTSR